MANQTQPNDFANGLPKPLLMSPTPAHYYSSKTVHSLFGSHREVHKFVRLAYGLKETEDTQNQETRMQSVFGEITESRLRAAHLSTFLWLYRTILSFQRLV